MTTTKRPDGGELSVGQTERGFAFGKFKDRYGVECSLQKSSLATEDCIWLGVHENRMHLTQEMAAMLLPALTAFAETGDLVRTPANESPAPQADETANDIADALERSTQSMARECKVGMGLWNGHSNACLNAIALLRKAAVPAPQPPVEGLREADKRWYLGSLNDGLFIINEQPRPSADDAFHDRTDGPTLVLNVTDLPEWKALHIVNAHNDALAALASPSLTAGPTSQMLLAGARSIGLSAHTDNHVQRARECWDAMTKAQSGMMPKLPSGYVTAEDRDRLLWLSENKSRIVRAVSDCFDPVILRRVDDALKVGVFVRPEGDISAAVEVLGPGTIERIDT